MKNNIKEIIIKKSGDVIPPVSNLPKKLNEWIDLSLRNNNKELSIHALRIPFILLSIIKNKQLINQTQLQLFDEDWFDITKETMNSIQFNVLIKDFLPKGSKNYRHVITGLDELVKYVTKEEFILENGNVVTLTSSIIGNFIHNKNAQGVKFDMNSYWYKVFLDISRTYNQIPIDTIFNISEVNSFKWYLYLKKIQGTGTNLHLDSLNVIFKTEHKYWSKVEERLLKPIKRELDENSDLSFNYEINNNKLYIAVYKTIASVPILNNLEDYKIDKAVRFKEKKYFLNEIEKAQLKSLYIRYGYNSVYNSTSRKRELLSLTGEKYLKELHKYLIAYVEKQLKKESVFISK
jgi:hypothetical protein